MVLTIFAARVAASGFPWGNNANCETFAPVKSIEDPLGHAATQAPHPMQAAESIANSAVSWDIKMVFASGALPVFTETYPPA